MIKSMTGFGRGKAESENYQLTVEIKAVNHRFLEIYSRLPRQLACCDDALKKHLQERFSRGKLDVYVTLDATGCAKKKVNIDKELAIGYYKALEELSLCCGIPADITLQQLAGMNGVLTLEAPEDDVDELSALLMAAADGAAEQLQSMRELEGAALVADLDARLLMIEQCRDTIATFAPQIVKEQKQRLEQRISLLLNAVEIDQSKLANELAFFADKVDISEELTRLASHIQQFRTTLGLDVPGGRKLEFILQEMLREINTIGSKSNALDVNKIVIEVKSELEKIREQIQNLE